MSCINLREQFGKRYRISVDRDSAEGPRDHNPWLQQIRCQRGLIYPYGANQLAVQVDRHPRIARALAALNGVVAVQNGDNELTFTFPIRLFARVARLVRPYRRPALADADRKRRVARMRTLNAMKNMGSGA